MKLETLLTVALEHGASDLHISSGLPPMMRIDGEIQYMDQYIDALSGCSEISKVLDAIDVSNVLDSILSESQQEKLYRQRQLDISLTIKNSARFRVNIFYQYRGIAAVFRVIPSTLPTLASLQCPHVFNDIIQANNGLVIVTGPTGSGKSTTLAAMVDCLNEQRRQHILTIEDPIEFIYEPKQCLINQRELHRDTLSFSDALRSGLREDPDVILIGEMRDLETVRLALTAAETGHLVLATLHTASAAKAVDRIVDIFPGEEAQLARSMLSESLRAVIAQSLVKKVGGGRTAVWEIMVATPAIRNLIRENKVAQMYSVMQMGRAQGMQTKEQHFKELLNAGLIYESNL